MRAGTVFKLMAVAAVLTLIGFIGGMAYMVRAKFAQSEYTLQLGASFNAAMLVNANETYTDEERAVIASYQGQRMVIVPENYRQVQSCLNRQAAMPLFGRVDEERALRISFCGASDMYVQPDEDGEGFTVKWVQEDGKKLVMHAAGGNHWERLLQYCLDGSSKTPNLPLH